MIGGMSAGRISSVLAAAEVIRQMVAEADEEIAKLSSVRL